MRPKPAAPVAPYILVKQWQVQQKKVYNLFVMIVLVSLVRLFTLKAINSFCRNKCPMLIFCFFIIF